MINMANAAPMTKDLGIEDISTEVLPTVSRPVPQHLAKFYCYMQRGKVGMPQLLLGTERESIFGALSFDPEGPYYNHATIYANAANARANPTMLQRVVPDDIGPNANLTLWLDVLSDFVDDYERNSDGSIRTDLIGNPIVIGQIPGYKVFWTVTSALTHGTAAGFGIHTQQTGSQTSSDGLRQSVRYPIFDFVVDTPGAYGNNLGIRLWTPRADLNQVPTSMMYEHRTFPYMLAVVEREDEKSTPEPVKSIFSEQAILVTMTPKSKDPTTGQKLFINDRFPAAYKNETDPSLPLVFPPFGKFHSYMNNINTLLAAFHAAESQYIDSFSDFSNDPSDFALFNFVSGQSANGVPYHSFVFYDSQESIRLSQYTDIMAAGGDDGTMNDEAFAKLVEREISRYKDRSDEVMDMGVSVESIFYDSGFPLRTKYVLPSFISQRHDTFLVLGTHVYGEKALDMAQEHSSAVSLLSKVTNYPESGYFGTPATRCMIMGCSGVIRNTDYRVPATYEILCKFARYMGAANGIWNDQYRPEANPGNIVEELVDLNMVWVPEDVRVRFWAVGLNWIGRFDLDNYYIPAYKTVYNNDTSILTSAINVLGICTVNKIGHKCHRVYGGASWLTNLQLCERVNNYIREETKGKFDGQLEIHPMAQVTDLDNRRGFSWTLPIGVGGNVAKTVQVLWTQADRLERLRARIAASA